MPKYLENCGIMHRNAAVLTVMCILLCLTFNYTFPLHREGSKWFMATYNHSRSCDRDEHEHRRNIADRTKNMASNIENAFRRFRDSTQDFSKNIQAHLNPVKNSLSEEDLRQYEQLVIMKKYPYLDLKEIELRFSPSDKRARQSDKYDAGTNYAGDPSICEPLDDGPSVEITNRGLTGFAIPAKVMKTTKLLETALKLNNPKDIADPSNPKPTVNKPNLKLPVNSVADVLESLKDDIVFYEEKKIK